MKAINLAVAFLLELAMLVAFAVWGFQIGETTAARFLLGLGAPALVAVFWGFFMAPRARRQLKGAAYLVVKVVLFALAAAALFAAGQATAAVVLGVVFLLNTALLYLLK